MEKLPPDAGIIPPGGNSFPEKSPAERLARLNIQKKWMPLHEWLVYFFALVTVIAITIREKMFSAVAQKLPC